MNHERSNTPDNNNQETKWSELEALGKKNFSSTNSDAIFAAKNEDSAAMKQDRIAQAAEDVRAVYRKQESAENSQAQETVFNDDYYSRLISHSTKQDNQNQESITSERSRIEEMKARLYKDNSYIQDYENQKISTPPSPLRKVARTFMDKLGIYSKRSERRREREAMNVALQEYYDEKEAQERSLAEAEEKRLQAQEKLEKETAERERKLLELAMAKARDNLEANRSIRFRNQRSQEIVEKDLNNRLVSVDNLEIEIASGNPEIAKRTISYEGSSIPVYDLNGIPFSMLSTTIDYRRHNQIGDIGTETYRAIMDNPSVWTERRDEVEEKSEFGTRKASARGDTISASYSNSEHNLTGHVEGELIYGFNHVDADSIILIKGADAGTGNMMGRNETELSDTKAIDKLEHNGSTMYNEILLRRYNETGVPKTPDYIIVKDGMTTKTVVEHAKYFNVPILNINTAAYSEKQKAHCREIMDTITEQDDYETLRRKLSELNSMSEFKLNYHTVNQIGVNNIEKTLQPYNGASPFAKECIELSKLELTKRLEYIAEKLKETIANINESTANGQLISHNPPGIEYFDVRVEDVKNGYNRTEIRDDISTMYKTPGNRNQISVDFMLNGDFYPTKTTISDGERSIDPEGNYSRNTNEKDADSSYYDAIEPLALDYFEACRKNNALKTKASASNANPNI